MVSCLGFFAGSVGCTGGGLPGTGTTTVVVGVVEGAVWGAVARDAGGIVAGSEGVGATGAEAAGSGATDAGGPDWGGNDAGGCVASGPGTRGFVALGRDPARAFGTVVDGETAGDSADLCDGGGGGVLDAGADTACGPFG